MTVTLRTYKLLVSKFKLLSDLVKTVQYVTAFVSEITPVEGLIVKRPAELPPVSEKDSVAHVEPGMSGSEATTAPPITPLQDTSVPGGALL